MRTTALLALLTAGTLVAEEQSPDTGPREESAEEARVILRVTLKAVDIKDLKAMGFDWLADPKRAQPQRGSAGVPEVRMRQLPGVEAAEYRRLFDKLRREGLERSLRGQHSPSSETTRPNKSSEPFNGLSLIVLAYAALRPAR